MANLKISKIYLKDSDKARLADIRARIVVETDPREPCDNEDLVFEKAEDEASIPENAIWKWKFDCSFEHEPIWFFTTAERCKEMVSKNPSDWTPEKLAEFEKIEKKLYQDWHDGNVYGFIIEKWDSAGRRWEQIESIWGMYGSEELVYNLADHLVSHGMKDTLVCIDTEDMKYDFDNVEKMVNEFT